MQPRVFPAMYWFITFIIMIFIRGSTFVFADDDERYVNCGNLFDCGDFKGVGYPFSGSNRPDYCGYPGLKLDCSDQDPEITIQKLTYKVLDINTQSRNLSVARKDYAENICPTLILNTTWIPNLLNYTSDDHNITIYYGCPPQGAPNFANSSLFSCPINTTEMTGFFTAVSDLTEFGNSASTLINYLASCKDSVEVPVRESALKKILGTPTVAQLQGGLNEGFDFVWNDSLCVTCKTSGGQCGYNQNTAAFSCYCKDQPREFSCQQSPPGAQSPTEAPSPSMSSCLLLFFSADVTLEVNRKTAYTWILTFSEPKICSPPN
ncbi:hypothetical protein SADUNF_Sadunf17G0110500 [Salix dunnii]|uniref:non-specific serine/threonine protein kinase n=1 Tax=Salix dunnii TaxID=1413687 RepID=A0A835J732_9ROSI|nr:hypothetical protein SADUNF_Sadunf17G0110500 [Salix dunnii]